MSIYHCLTMRPRERTQFQSLTAHLLEPLACCHATHFENLLRCRPFWMHKKGKFPASQPIKTHQPTVTSLRHSRDWLGCVKGKKERERHVDQKSQDIYCYLIISFFECLWKAFSKNLSFDDFWLVSVGPESSNPQSQNLICLCSAGPWRLRSHSHTCGF